MTKHWIDGQTDRFRFILLHMVSSSFRYIFLKYLINPLLQSFCPIDLTCPKLEQALGLRQSWVETAETRGLVAASKGPGTLRQYHLTAMNDDMKSTFKKSLFPHMSMMIIPIIVMKHILYRSFFWNWYKNVIEKKTCRDFSRQQIINLEVQRGASLHQSHWNLVSLSCHLHQCHLTWKKGTARVEVQYLDPLVNINW